MIMSGRTIRELGIITPYVRRGETSLKPYGRVSHGESMAGYDLRLFDIDKPAAFVRDGVKAWVLKPGDFVLAVVDEHLSMPDDLLAIVHDKSTWARQGLAVQNTVVEPGWCGYLTLELSNHGCKDVVVWQGCGICQIIFHKLDRPVEGYDGKYQDQPKKPVEAL